MSSQLQIEANRRNSQKSTGPRTPAGRANSSRNALASGLYAQSQIIIGESQADFEGLAAAFHSRYHPDSPGQQSLLDIAIHSEWILRRLRRAETGLWDYYIEEYEHGADTTGLGRAFDARDKTLSRLQRRLDSLQRNFQRALKELSRLQPDTPPALCGAGASACQPVSSPPPLAPSQIGFVSSPEPPALCGAGCQPAADCQSASPGYPPTPPHIPTAPGAPTRLCYTGTCLPT